MLRAIVLLIAAMAILIPALIVHFAPPVVRHLVAHPLPTRVVPQAEVPPVEPDLRVVGGKYTTVWRWCCCRRLEVPSYAAGAWRQLAWKQ